jgi:hypothetical protein
MRHAEHEIRFRHGHGRRHGGWGATDGAPPSADDAAAWFAGRLPDGWFTGAPELSVDRDEVIVVGTLEAPAVDGDDAAKAAAEQGRIKRFREETREARVDIAREAEHRYGRKVAWGATAGATTEVFTTVSVPVMTRLRQPERQVLDTLVDAGVARSRSDALAWCVRLVGRHQEEWIASLRDALVAVEDARSQGPEV